jgi:hypothetical protein
MPDDVLVPEKRCIDAFMQFLKGHTKVRRAQYDPPHLVTIERTYGDNIKAYVTDLYTLGIADVMEALEENPDIKAVITISNWNGYTVEAKDYGGDRRVGVFKGSEFFGALNRERNWWKYRPK